VVSPQPASWPPETNPYPAGPVSGHPVSSQPVSSQPTSGYPVSGQPTSGYPVSGQPVSGYPASGDWSAQSYPPAVTPTWQVSGAPDQSPGVAQTSVSPQSPWTDPLAVDPNNWQPRIVPTPPQPKSKLWIGVLAGFLIGVLLAAPTVYFLTPGDSDPAPSPTTPTAPAAAAALGPLEKNQLALNRPRFHDDLAVLAASWLPFVTNCLAAGEEGGPRIGPDEKEHVLCRYGNIFIHFAWYKTPVDRNNAREDRKRFSTQFQNLAPGLSGAVQKPRTSDPTVGTYIEYALDAHGPAAGIWWDATDDKSVAIYLEANWDNSLGKSWDPLRDLWQRHS
jgi:hypothetical protein